MACGLARTLILGLWACGGDPAIDAALEADSSMEQDASVDASTPDAGTDAGCGTGVPPSPVAGSCTAVVSTPAALRPVGADGPERYVLPGGRRVLRVASETRLPGFPMGLVAVPGTSFAIVSDGGVETEQLSVVDLSTRTVVGQRSFAEAADSALFHGVAVSSDGRRVFVSGGGSNVVREYGFELTTGQLSEVAIHRFASTTAQGYVSDIVLLGDDRTLVVGLMFGGALVVYDTQTSTELRRVSLPARSYPFGIAVAEGATPGLSDDVALVTLWSAGAVVPVDLGTGNAHTPVAVGKNPEGVEIRPGGAEAVIASSDSDRLSVLSMTTLTIVRELPIGDAIERGASPAAVAFSNDGLQLFVTVAGENAIDVWNTATWSRVGRVPTMWYPTDVAMTTTGDLVWTTGKFEGTGANATPHSTDILDLVGGSVASLPNSALSDDALQTWASEIRAANLVPTGFQSVECPGDAYDFPIPRSGEGASTRIRHVFLIVRENKTYDAYFGDLRSASGTPHGNGDARLTLLPSEEMDVVLPNTRELARTFAHADNYYSLAEQSVQGHLLTTLGRTTDFIERSWLTTWGRSYYSVPPQGTTDLGLPEEGTSFEYLRAHDVPVQNYGEIVSSRNVAPDSRFPGLIYNLSVRDVDKVDFVARELQRCRVSGFTYLLLPNDHTSGARPGAPTPRSMIADNDEAVGRIVDAISHSSLWPEAVIFIIQDDPQDGGDHVDNHRSPLLVISPWAKRGYVGSVHFSEASIYRTIQLIYGIEQPLSASWAAASPLYEFFSSTPDYTPYMAIGRRQAEEMNPAGTGTAFEAQSMRWDFRQPDNQPGLSRALWRHFRGSEAPWAVRDELLSDVDEASEEGPADL